MPKGNRSRGGDCDSDVNDLSKRPVGKARGRISYDKSGGMGEWLKPAVLKTVSGVTRSGVRIPLPPPENQFIRTGHMGNSSFQRHR